MVELSNDHPRRKNSPELIFRWMISCIFAILTQLSLLLIPNFFPSFSLLSHLLLSAVVLVLAIGFGQFFRRLIGIRASPPAFVFFHIIFIWAVYLGVIREAVSSPMDIILNGELVILLTGFFRILVSDPGFVHHDSADLKEDSVSEDGAYPQELQLLAGDTDVQRSTKVTSLSSRRVRYCRSCKAYVRGFDHHCPALGNCIGQMNYVLFTVLLGGFITTEASYATCSYQWLKRYKNLNSISSKITLFKSLAVSTMLFSLLQVLWQVVFLAWHIYCICFNIRADEWINWRRYPEFHVVVQPSEGELSPEVRFRNPYDKGIFRNLKEFLLTQDQELIG